MLVAVERGLLIGVGSFSWGLGFGAFVSHPVGAALIVVGSLPLLLAAASTDTARRRFPGLDRLPLVRHVATAPLRACARGFDRLARQAANAEHSYEQAARVRSAYIALVERVDSELHRHDPGALADWQKTPPDLQGPVRYEAQFLSRAATHSAEKLRRIIYGEPR